MQNKVLLPIKMLMRMENARGLHLVAVCEEIDTVTKAFKRSFTSYSDALRVSFDNAPYGQDYASESTYSGLVPLYYNTLFSSTPRAMRRFYPDVEDGLVSRVCFITLPEISLVEQKKRTSAMASFFISTLKKLFF